MKIKIEDDYIKKIFKLTKEFSYVTIQNIKDELVEYDREETVIYSENYRPVKNRKVVKLYKDKNCIILHCNDERPLKVEQILVTINKLEINLEPIRIFSNVSDSVNLIKSFYDSENMLCSCSYEEHKEIKEVSYVFDSIGLKLWGSCTKQSHVSTIQIFDKIYEYLA